MKTIIFILAACCSIHISAQSCSAPVAVLVTSMKNKPYAGDKIIFTGKSSHKSVSGISDAKGSFTIDLPCGDIYDIKVASVGEEMEYNTLEIPTLQAGEQFQDMKLHITYDLPSVFTLTDLKFETAKATIQASSYSTLNTLADFLKRKPTMIVEVAGHTDSDGDDQMNMNLSRERANAVKAYLISKGVPAKQIKAAGYGKTRPIADNNSASGKQQNRRTEILILSE